MLKHIGAGLSSQLLRQPVPDHKYERALALMQQMQAALVGRERYSMCMLLCWLICHDNVALPSPCKNGLCSVYMVCCSLMAEHISLPLRAAVLSASRGQCMPAAASHLLGHLMQDTAVPTNLPPGDLPEPRHAQGNTYGYQACRSSLPLACEMPSTGQGWGRRAWYWVAQARAAVARTSASP